MESRRWEPLRACERLSTRRPVLTAELSNSWGRPARQPRFSTTSLAPPVTPKLLYTLGGRQVRRFPDQDSLAPVHPGHTVPGRVTCRRRVAQRRPGRRFRRRVPRGGVTCRRRVAQRRQTEQAHHTVQASGQTQTGHDQVVSFARRPRKPRVRTRSPAGTDRNSGHASRARRFAPSMPPGSSGPGRRSGPTTGGRAGVPAVLGCTHSAVAGARLSFVFGGVPTSRNSDRKTVTTPNGLI